MKACKYSFSAYTVDFWKDAAWNVSYILITLNRFPILIVLETDSSYLK